MAQKKTTFSSEARDTPDLGAFLANVAHIRKQWPDKPKAESRGDLHALWYRGQGEANWGLTPKRYRPEYAAADESEMRLEFESAGRQLVAPDQMRDMWTWYFLMAHYGAPTRLLDWTVNPLVALYFALSAAPRDGSGSAAVWVIDPWNWNSAHVPDLYGPASPGWLETKPYLMELEAAAMSEGGDALRKWPIAIEPPYIDKRLTAQEGRFLLFGTEKDAVSSPHVSRRNKRSKRVRLDKILVPHAHVEPILDELNLMSINSKTIFPDLAGLGTYISWKWKSYR